MLTAWVLDWVVAGHAGDVIKYEEKQPNTMLRWIF